MECNVSLTRYVGWLPDVMVDAEDEGAAEEAGDADEDGCGEEDDAEEDAMCEMWRLGLFDCVKFQDEQCDDTERGGGDGKSAVGV